MASKPVAVKKIQGVVLLRPGAGAEEYTLPPGATLADLLRAAHADPGAFDVRIDGAELHDAVALRPGMVVTLTPRPEPSRDAWRATAGMFQDDPVFEEMMEDVRANREAERREAEERGG